MQIVLSGFRSDVLAENVSTFGISFPVDSLSTVDDQSVKLTLFGATRIIKRENLESFVVDSYLRQDGVQRLIPYAHMQKLIQAALDAGNIEIAASALLRLLRNYSEADGPLSEETPNGLQYIEQLSAQPQSTELFKRCLYNVPFDSLGREHTPISTEHVVRLLYFVAIEDLPWVRTYASRGVFLFVPEFKRVLSTKFIEAVHAEQHQQLTRIIDVGRELFGESDELIQRLRVLLSRIEQIRDGGPEDIASLEAFIQICRADPFSEQILCPVINQYIVRKADQALLAHDAVTALLFIARIDVEKRTPRTHEIVLETLRAIEPEALSIVRDSKVDSFLQILSGVDPSIHHAYLRVLEDMASYLYGDGASSDLERVLAAIQRLRPDPNSGNDEVRVKLSIVYLREGMRSLAIHTLSKVNTGISVLQRFRLSLAGLYVNRYIAYLLLFSLIGLVGWYFQFELKRLRAARLAAFERAQRASAAEFGFGPIDIEELERRQREGELHPDLMEYEKLLSRLGLGLKSPLKEIKTTYRNMVKTLHPDLTQGSGVETSSEFIELTRIYDRVLDLRKILGLADE